MRGRKGEFRKELAELQKQGFQRVKINGTFHEIADAPKLDKKFKHDIDVVVDRIVVRKDIAQRLADSVETALQLADGICILELADKPLAASGKRAKGAATVEDSDANGAAAGSGILQNKNETHERVIFSARFACPVSGFTIEEIEPRLFSFNAPAGACPTCDGLGTELHFEPELVVPDGTLSLGEGGVYPWAKTGATSPYYEQTLAALARHFGVSMSTPWDKLPKPVRDAILFGTDGEEITFVYEDGLRNYKTEKPFEGVIGNIERRWRETEVRLGARRALPLPGRPPLRRLRRLSPEAAVARRQDRRPAHRRGRRPVDPRRQRLVRRPPQDVHQASRPRSPRAS